MAHFKGRKAWSVVGCGSGGRGAGTQTAMVLALPEEMGGMVVRLKEGDRGLGKRLPCLDCGRCIAFHGLADASNPMEVVSMECVRGAAGGLRPV